MLTNPFNTSSSEKDPFKEMFSGDYTVVVIDSARINQARIIQDYRSRRFTEHFLGGLKGKMAPGDAHPYLALFYLLKNDEPAAFNCGGLCQLLPRRLFVACLRGPVGGGYGAPAGGLLGRRSARTGAEYVSHR